MVAPEVVSNTSEEQVLVNDETQKVAGTDDVHTNGVEEPEKPKKWGIFKGIDHGDLNMPLSKKASTRLRQMLARPGIVVSTLLRSASRASL